MSTVEDSKGIGNVEITELSKSLRESFGTVFFIGMKAQVLKQENGALTEVLSQLPGSPSDAVVRMKYLRVHEARENGSRS
jgi:hypothetical protein